ncbi:ribosome maturation factor RimM [Treponema brennaborense]|uniref:Ribosome maturation factor RimM n=1 Tax=Treponema brennaborense (strain DSM 12168 / CIP 105900 / DD5/3) TaxID=906968 RepID=F4LJ83_TREBD|nr:ribosome maturation factor RimM [Treponema brennaborense]AEE16340.1 Ribosome maturation factor rimM [Treponema brennaborense DSM 12168]
MEHFVVGIIRGAHGLSGNLKVVSTSGEYGHFAGMKEVTVRKGDVQKSCKIEFAEEGTGVLYLKCAGIDTAEDAKRYTGWEIIVPRESACPCAPDEYYIEDLKGCALVYCTGSAQDGLAAGSAPTEVGTITDVLEGGAGDLLEVALAESCELLAPDVRQMAGGDPRTVLVPFKREFIGTVDIERKLVQLMHLWILE